jgi:hypothetical protein
LENRNGDFAARQVLLLQEIRVYREQHIKGGFRQGQQFAVLLSSAAASWTWSFLVRDLSGAF